MSTMSTTSKYKLMTEASRRPKTFPITKYLTPQYLEVRKKNPKLFYYSMLMNQFKDITIVYNSLF